MFINNFCEFRIKIVPGIFYIRYKLKPFPFYFGQIMYEVIEIKSIALSDSDAFWGKTWEFNLTHTKDS